MTHHCNKATIELQTHKSRSWENSRWHNRIIWSLSLIQNNEQTGL